MSGLGELANAKNLQTSKSQQNGGTKSGGIFKWANISNVHGVVSGAMSGLSAYIWNNTATSKSNQEEGTNGGAEKAATVEEGETDDAREVDHEKSEENKDAQAGDSTSKKSQDGLDLEDDA
jgi:hypothetical protein